MKSSLKTTMIWSVLFLLIWFFGCATTKIKPNLTPEDRLQTAKLLLDKHDYLRAKTEFTILVLNYPGTQIADKSQYYLAESHFGLKEYILAAAEYEKMIRNYPSSDFADDAQFKLGLCYYELSPNYALDQKYTYQAIVEFQRFLEEYPNSDLKPEVEKKLSAGRLKLAKKEYKSADLYRKMAEYQAAVVYFDGVLNNYYDTPFAEEALFRKGECLMKLKQWQEALKVFEVFLEKYPQSNLIETTRAHLKLVQGKM